MKMNMRKKISKFRSLGAVAFFGLSTCAAARAGNAASSAPESLTEESAVTGALRSNYDLKSAAASVEVAKAELTKSGLWPNPEAEFSTRSDKYHGNRGEGGYEYGLTQTIPISGRTFFNRRAAGLGVERAEWQRKDVERRVVAEVKRTFHRIAALQEKEKISSFAVKINEGLVESVQARLSHAEVSSVDVSLARGELLMAGQELAAVKARLYEARAALNGLLGQNPNTPFIIVSEPLVFPSIDLETAVQKSLARRPDLKALELGKTMGAAALALARAMRIPDITVGGFYQSDRSRFDVNNQLISDDSRLVGGKVSIPLPFFDRNQGEIAKAAAGKKGSDIQYEALQAQVVKEATRAYIRMAASKQIIGSYYSDGAKDDVEKSVKLIQDAYIQGRVSVFDVVQTENKLINIEKAYLDAGLGARESIIDLESAMGAGISGESRKGRIDEN